MVFCLPIAFAEQYPAARLRFEGYCKAALFLVRQVLHHWDVRAEGVPIYIGVSQNGLETFKAYASQCNFPESQVVVLSSYTTTWAGWNSKFELLGAPQIASFERRLHFDVSAWLHPQADNRPVCRELLSAWGDAEFLIRYRDVRTNQGSSWVDGVPLEFFMWLGNLFGRNAEIERAYWFQEGVEKVNGLMFGFTQAMWQEAQPLLKMLLSQPIRDEVVLAVLARELRWASRPGILNAHNRFFPDLKRMVCFHPAEDRSALMQEWQEGYVGC